MRALRSPLRMARSRLFRAIWAHGKNEKLVAVTRTSLPYLAVALLTAGALAACSDDQTPAGPPAQAVTAGMNAIVGGGPLAGAGVAPGVGGTPAMVGTPGLGSAGVTGAAGMTMTTAGTAAPMPACGSTSPDGDGDGAPDCMDMCAMDRAKTAPGVCGCGMPETDANMNGTPDCMDTMPEPEPVDPDACKIGPIPADVRAEYELGAFYTRYASADGTPVVATDAPVEESIVRACKVVLDLSSKHPMARERMRSDHVYFIMMAKSEKTVDTPEYRSRGDIDNRARGLGNNPGLCAEENVMCDRTTDRWRGESICVHEYSHVMHLYVWNRVDSMFNGKVTAAYNNAVRTMGLYRNTYAASNAVEYFAEGVQNWYNTNLQSSRGEAGDGVHNHINTRAELEAYDPMLYELLATVLPDVPAYEDCYYYE
jgi:hypothetical protein